MLSFNYLELNFSMRSILLILLSGILFCSCQITVKKDDSSKNKNMGSSSKIRNGIILNENGLKVSEAYLTYEDGSLVSNENAIDIDKKSDHASECFRLGSYEYCILSRGKRKNINE